MKKIALYLDNRLISDIDASRIYEGNPGIGGTEYLILLLSYMLSVRNNGIIVKLYMRVRQLIPTSIECETVKSLNEAIDKSSMYDYFVLKHDVDNIKNDSIYSNGTLKFIIWCHVFACFWELDYYARNPYVYRFVCVGREMLDLYRDHPIFKKAVYIYNGVNLKDCREQVHMHPFLRRRNVITYIGNIVPFKGFHVLAQAWPKILEQVPDAELYVIGNGRLYNSTFQLGRFGIAESSYENILMKYLSKDGEILPSVHFMGRMGTEKNKILLNTKVGVPNPLGTTETFCLSAVEMQAMGARIATIKAPGFLDTVRNGILYLNPSELANTVIGLLKTNVSHYEEAMSFFEANFSFDTVTEKWELLLRGEGPKQEQRLENKGYRLKWLKELIRKISLFIPINMILPPVERFLLFFERKVWRKTTFMDSDVRV